MKITKRYLTVASVILFIISFFFYLFEYNLYGKKISSGKNDYFQARTTTSKPKKLTLNEIIKNVNIMEKNQCQKYKKEINEYCLDKYNRNIKNYYDLTIDAEDLETFKISKQICCTLKQVYIQCNFAYLNIICSPDEMATVFEPIQTQMDICTRYFESGDQCYLIANFSKDDDDDDSTESDEDDDD